MDIYRLQMKAGSKGKTITDSVLKQNKITADEEYAGESFLHLNRGDLILVHKGAYPEALVQVENRVDEDDLIEESFGIDYSIKILSWFADVAQLPMDFVNLWGTVPYSGTFFHLYPGKKVYTRILNWYNYINKQNMDNKIKNLLENKKQIILQGPPGTGKTYTAKDIAEMIIFNEISIDKKYQKQKLENTDQFKLIQFHPAYSYEDFVRGISAKSKGERVEYSTENRTIAQFANIALANYVNSQKSPGEFSEIRWLDEQFANFVDSIREKLENNAGQVNLTEAISIVDIDEDAFRYKGQEGWNPYGNRMLFKDIKKSFLDKNKSRQDIVKNIKLSGLARHHASYFFKVLELFRKFLAENNIVFTPSDDIEKLKNYVLIIDEINRANLPAVLGELIYALEYRGEQVDSIYEIEGEGKSIVLPPNLYIIGTMNTADRSVGHIDYAIRRRFAFVPVQPDINVISEVIKDETLRGKAENLFKSVSDLFTKKNDNGDSLLYLAKDFKAEDVQIGHSYFLAKTLDELNLKLDYEIKPILNEYLKDGVLIDTEEIRKKIRDLNV